MRPTVSEKAKTTKTPQGVSRNHSVTCVVTVPTERGAVVVFCEPSKVAEVKAKPVEHWQQLENAHAEAHNRLGISPEEVLNFLSKIRWNLSVTDAEMIPHNIRQAMYRIVKLIRAQTDRMLPGAHAKGLVGGRPRKS